MRRERRWRFLRPSGLNPDEPFVIALNYVDFLPFMARSMARHGPSEARFRRDWPTTGGRAAPQQGVARQVALTCDREYDEAHSMVDLSE